MEIQRLTLPPRSAPGDVTTFYSFEGASARSVALTTMAVLLAGRQDATVPVLMIDFDTASPGLHHAFGLGGGHGGERPGLLEYFQACRDQLRVLGRGHPARKPPGRDGDDPDDTVLARQVLDSVDWEPFVERVDLSRPLYLMRAGSFDDTYGERADQFDWDGLFQLCPALFRCFGEFMAQRFTHVLVDARSGRSAEVSICTTLLPRRLVTVFTPAQRSLDGLAGVVTRAIDYRCSHEHEQRPLLVYPLPAAIDSADSARRLLWRRGDPHKAVAGYQSVIEQLLRQCYGVSRVSLDSYFDEVQLPQLHAMAGIEPLAHGERDADRFSLTRTFDTLLDWLTGNYFPWQSHAEVRLAGAIGAARERLGGGVNLAWSLPLARDLHQLGLLHRGAGRAAEAIACFEESIHLRQRLLGDEHADTRASRAQLATLLGLDGRLAEAQFLQELLLEDCARLLGPEHPDTLAARAALAATLASRGDFGRALALHEQVIDTSERLYGAAHMHTLSYLAAQARTLTRHGELSRARMVYERVLDGRERLLGSEHEQSLRCAQDLSTLLRELGDLGNARKLQEGVLAARERHAGPDHPATMQARELLAEIMAAQSDLAGVRQMLELVARSRERSLGAAHPDTLSTQLRLASTLSEQGDRDAARRLQQKLAGAGADPAAAGCDPAAGENLPRAGHGADPRFPADPGQQGSRQGAPHGGPGAARLEPLARPTSILDAPPDSGGADTLGHKLAQLQELIDRCSEREARALADSLRKPVLRRNVPPPLRKRGLALIRLVYLRNNDKDALLALAQDEVSFLQEALNDAVSGRPVSAQ